MGALYPRLLMEDLGVAHRLATHGAAIIAAPRTAPTGGPDLRTAHLRMPDGILVEPRSY